MGGVLWAVYCRRCTVGGVLLAGETQDALHHSRLYICLMKP